MPCIQSVFHSYRVLFKGRDAILQKQQAGDGGMLPLLSSTQAIFSALVPHGLLIKDRGVVWRPPPYFGALPCPLCLRSFRLTIRATAFFSSSSSISSAFLFSATLSSVPINKIWKAPSYRWLIDVYKYLPPQRSDALCLYVTEFKFNISKLGHPCRKSKNFKPKTESPAFFCMLIKMLSQLAKKRKKNLYEPSADKLSEQKDCFSNFASVFAVSSECTDGTSSLPDCVCWAQTKFRAVGWLCARAVLPLCYTRNHANI